MTLVWCSGRNTEVLPTSEADAYIEYGETVRQGHSGYYTPLSLDSDSVRMQDRCTRVDMPVQVRLENTLSIRQAYSDTCPNYICFAI